MKLGSIALGYLVLLAACEVGENSAPLEVAADDPLPPELGAGDVVRAGAIAVEVPDPGETVSIIGEYTDGTRLQLTITNPLDGRVMIEPTAPDEVVDPLAVSGSACSDGAYNLTGHRWVTEYRWRFHSGSTPDGNNRDNFETAFKQSVNAIVTSRNDCGLADQVSATAEYLGRTSTTPDITAGTSSVTCTARDGVNVVGFGSLPSGMLGVACSWWATDTKYAREGDIRLTTRERWFGLDVPSGCSNRFGIRNVATHEFGHVFGLDHVSESAHGNLTMSTAARACTNSDYSLGLGDVRALRALY